MSRFHIIIRMVPVFLAPAMALFCVQPARAQAITLGAFSGCETVETFNPNFGRANSPVTFHGVTYSEPAPPDQSAAQLWSNIDWTNNGYFRSIPGASQGFALNDLVATTNLTITFSTPVNRVGLLLGTSLITSWTLTAYGDDLQPLGSTTVTMPANFVGVFGGLESSSNIRSLNILEVPNTNNQITILDDLRYEPTGIGTRPCITNPQDGASPQSQFVALSGTGTAGDTLNVLVDGVAIGINGVGVDSEGNWEALAYVGGRAAPSVQVHDRTSFLRSNAITVHPLQAGFAGPPVPGNLFTAVLPLRRADIFVDGDASSPQVVLYGPTYTHTAVYLGGDSEGTPWIAEAVTASEAGIWGQVRSVLLEQSLVWRANRLSAFKPISPLSLATRSTIVSWASTITTQGLPYWNTATDLTGPILGAYAVFVATGGLLSSRFNGFLGLLNSNKYSTTKFICSTLVWRAYWEGTGHTLDISTPNLMSIAPGSLLSNLNPILSTQFLIQLSPVFVVPETFVRSPKLKQIF